MEGKEVVVCFSGGKDSTVMLLRMIELGEKIDHIIFTDTEAEYPELYEYINRIEKLIKKKITILKSRRTLSEWMNGNLTRGKNKGEKRGFPFVLSPCYWMRESKLYPINRFLNNKKFIRCLGIAKDEEHRVQKDKSYRYPLIEWGWSEQDCINYLNKKKLLNPLYLNFKRIGCYFCPKQPDYSKWMTWKGYPELWKKIKDLEQENLKLCGRNIFAKPIIEYETEWKQGKIPKMPNNYECFECKGVLLNATGQLRLCNKYLNEEITEEEATLPYLNNNIKEGLQK